MRYHDIRDLETFRILEHPPPPPPLETVQTVQEERTYWAGGGYSKDEWKEFFTKKGGGF